MQPYVLYHPKSRTTGRAIASALGIASGKHCTGQRCEKFSHIIRWGNAEQVSATWWDGVRARARQFINTAEAVALASSKYRSLVALERNGVSVPRFTRDAGEVDEWLRNRHTVFGRKFHHTRGQDIQIYYPNPGRFDGNIRDVSDFFTRYVPTHKEYRIHVFRENIIWAQKKVLDAKSLAELEDELDGAEKVDLLREEAEIIRNHSHGWNFVHFNDLGNVPTNVKTQAILAVDLLGLDFGAVDVISTKELDANGKRKAYVLEVNTAPALEGPSLETYTTFLSTLLGRINE